jgi:hypothetical protein
MASPSRKYGKLIYMRPQHRLTLEELARTMGVSHSEAVRCAVEHYAQTLPNQRRTGIRKEGTALS